MLVCALSAPKTSTANLIWRVGFLLKRVPSPRTAVCEQTNYIPVLFCISSELRPALPPAGLSRTVSIRDPAKQPANSCSIFLKNEVRYWFSIKIPFGALSLMALATFAAAQASGANYYVSPTGSNSNPCTQSSPCATPDHAFNLASVGQTVQVAAGTYDYGSGAAQFTKSGTAGNYITVTCAAREACKIQNSVTGNSTVVMLSGSYITFDGFEVTNTSSAGNNLGLYVTASFVNITHNTIHHIETDCGSNGGGGIQIAGSGSSNSDLPNITIQRNLIYHTSLRNGSPGGAARP